MMAPESIQLIALFLAAHFIYWNVTLLIVLRQYQRPAITNPRVGIIPSTTGDDVTIGGSRYCGIRRGDIVFRPLHFFNEKKLYKVYSMRFLSLGMPGTLEHAAVYLGQGKVMNVNPNIRPTIQEQPLAEFIQGFHEDNIHFLRLSDKDTTNERAIEFIYWHQQLEVQGKTGVIKIPMLRKKVLASDATPIQHDQFPYYITGYNCNSLVQDAFAMAQVPGIEQLANHFSEQVFSTLGLLLFPSQKRIQYFVQSFFTSGEDLREIAQTIVPDQIEPQGC